MKSFLKSCLIKTIIFIALILLVISITSCSEQKQELPEGKMLRYELENTENTMWQTYTLEEKQTDLFEKWQERQPNELAQKEWDAYMENEDN